MSIFELQIRNAEWDKEYEKKILNSKTINSSVLVISFVAFAVDINVGAKKFASLTSVSYSDFGESKTGKNTDIKYEKWGETSFHVEDDEKTVIGGFYLYGIGSFTSLSGANM